MVQSCLINATGYTLYNQKAKNKMQFKATTLQNFMRNPNPNQLKLIEHSEPLLSAFFSETCEPSFERKITLTDQYLVISQKRGDDYEPSLFLQISETLTFQRLQQCTDLRSKNPNIDGFALFNNNHETIRIYLQFPALSELWACQLAQHLNQRGFSEHYKIIDRIGKGSTSTVYKVQRLSDGRLFAAKAFLKSFLESKPQRKSSVFNEISLLRAMDHKNILKIHGVYQSNSAIYIITEHLEGGTLFERINTARGFQLPNVKKIMKGIIEGLNYMHRFGIMHRDIKLENIMFRSKDSLEVVIVDFGLAAVSDDEPYIFYRCGTPGFIAPEIIGMQSNERIDVVCDIFSAGVIFHILLTNKYLFVGQNNQQVYKANKCLDFDLEDESYAKYDPQAMELLSEMLEIDHEERIHAEDVMYHQFFDEVEERLGEKDAPTPAVTTTQEEVYIL